MMTTSKWLTRGSLAAAVLLLAACSGDFAGDLVSPTDPSLTETDYDGTIWVIKQGPEGTYSFEASEDPVTGSLLFTSFSLQPGDQEIIWSTNDPTVNSTVTVTELLQAGFQVDSIWVVEYAGGVWQSETKYYGVNEVSVQGSADRKVRIKFFNSETEGGEGCTPGFWRQPQHFDYWTGYSPSDDYDQVFGLAAGTYGATLLEAVWAGGGGVDALARHSVAALLNATSPDVDYPATEAEVIAAVQAAFASGDYEAQKDIFAGWNEFGCLDDTE